MTTDIHSLSGAYVVDALDDAERLEFEAHLRDCAACQREVAELAAVTEALAEEVAEVPPPSLKADVLAAIDTVRPLPPIVPAGGKEGGAAGPGGSAAPSRRPLPWILGAGWPSCSSWVWSWCSSPAAHSLPKRPLASGPPPRRRCDVDAPHARTSSSSSTFSAKVVVEPPRTAPRSSPRTCCRPRGQDFQPGTIARPWRWCRRASCPTATTGSRSCSTAHRTTPIAVGVTVEPDGGSRTDLDLSSSSPSPDPPLLSL